MNPIQKALDLIKFEIPPQILRAFFVSTNLINRHQNINIDEHILAQVIRPRVLVDCSLVGGAEININMNGLASDIVDPLTTVYRIPKERTQGRSIMSVLSIAYVDANSLVNWGSSIPTCGVSAIGTAANALLSSQTPPAIAGTARVRLIGDNVIEVRDAQRMATYGSCRAIVANDENMSHLQPASYYDFAELCLHAVKGYIYNQYIIDIDVGQLHAGQNIGRFKDEVERFADSNENYRTYLKEHFTAVQKLNDGETAYRLIKAIVGGYR